MSILSNGRSLFVFNNKYSSLYSDMGEMTSWFVTSFSGVLTHYLNFPQVKLIQWCRVSHLEQSHCRMHSTGHAIQVIVIRKSGGRAECRVLRPGLVIDEV